MDVLALPWANTRVAHLLAIRRMTPVGVGSDWEEGCKTDQDSPLMYTQKVEMLEPFSSHVIPVRMMEAYLGEHLNVMLQACIPRMAPYHLALLCRICIQN